MSTTRAALLALVTKWRQESAHGHAGDPTRKSCAAQLEAALAAHEDAPRQPEDAGATAAPKPIDESFLRGVVRSATSYSEGWREVCARLLWVEQELQRRSQPSPPRVLSRVTPEARTAMITLGRDLECRESPTCRLVKDPDDWCASCIGNVLAEALEADRAPRVLSREAVEKLKANPPQVSDSFGLGWDHALDAVLRLCPADAPAQETTPKRRIEMVEVVIDGERRFAEAAPAAARVECPECGGEGRIHSHNDFCNTCKGKKMVNVADIEDYNQRHGYGYLNRPKGKAEAAPAAEPRESYIGWLVADELKAARAELAQARAEAEQLRRERDEARVAYGARLEWGREVEAELEAARAALAERAPGAGEQP